MWDPWSPKARDQGHPAYRDCALWGINDLQNLGGNFVVSLVPKSEGPGAPAWCPELFGDGGGYAVPDCAIREKDIVFLIEFGAAIGLNIFGEPGWIVAGN